MVLDGILTNDKKLEEITKSKIWLVISLINMLLCLVNDQLDLKTIDLGKFCTKVESFKPAKTFEFILKMFDAQSKFQKC